MLTSIAIALLVLAVIYLHKRVRTLGRKASDLGRDVALLSQVLDMDTSDFAQGLDSHHRRLRELEASERRRSQKDAESNR